MMPGDEEGEGPWDAAARAAFATARAEGRASWPALAVDEPTFAEFVAARIDAADLAAGGLIAARAADLYLACACANGVDGAATAFESSVMPHVQKAVARVDSSAVFLDEVSERVRVKLLVASGDEPPRIASYLGGGPLASFAQVVGLREAQSLKRKKQRETPVENEALLDIPIESADPELMRLRDQIRGPFRQAFRDALFELSPRDRNILRLYLVDGVASETIARMYRVHRGTVARWVSAARGQVLASTRARLMKELKLGRASFDSLLGNIASGLDITLSTFLREGDAEPE